MVHTTESSGLKSFTPLGIIKNVTSIHFGFLARGLFYDASLKVRGFMSTVALLRTI
jgi:hypothetical protein